MDAEPMEAPIFIGELELTEPISSVGLPVRQDGFSYTDVRLLVRIQHIPVGYVFLRPEGQASRQATSHTPSSIDPHGL